jgi:hypothetical protein
MWESYSVKPERFVEVGGATDSTAWASSPACDDNEASGLG